MHAHPQLLLLLFALCLSLHQSRQDAEEGSVIKHVASIVSLTGGAHPTRTFLGLPHLSDVRGRLWGLDLGLRSAGLGSCSAVTGVRTLRAREWCRTLRAQVY